MADLIADLDAAIDLGVLASRAAASSFHFHRIFRGMVGETPLSLSRRLKLERAAWVLTNTDQSVLDVAFSAGYETHESFTRAFRAAYSTSPSGFRVTVRTRASSSPRLAASISTLEGSTYRSPPSGKEKQTWT